MELEFSGEVWHWRGPAPYYFVVVPDEESAELRAESSVTSYGWGCIRIEARIDDTEWTTSLMPKDGRYLVPLKDKVRHALDVDEGDTITVWLATSGPA